MTLKLVTNRKAVSPVIATLLLIAIAVAAGIILYIFVGGLTNQLSNVKGTVTQPLGIKVLTANCAAGSTASNCYIDLSIINPNSLPVIISGATVKDPTGAAVLGLAISSTATSANSFGCGTAASGASTVSSNTVLTFCTSTNTSTKLLSPGVRYSVSVFGVDTQGNSVQSNADFFTAQ